MARLTSQAPQPPDVPPGTRGAVTVRVSSQRRPLHPQPKSTQGGSSMGQRILAVLVTALGLWGAGSALMMSARWGVTLMLDPTAAPWLDALGWLAGPDGPQHISLDQLRHTLAQQGLTVGDPQTILLEVEPPLVVVPVLSHDPQHLQELRLYQGTAGTQPTERLILRDRLTVMPLAPQTVLAPLAPLGQRPQAAPDEFAFTQFTPLPAPDPWFTLEGTWGNQGLTLRYGQLVYVHPTRAALVPLAPWSSPANQLPLATDLDGQEPVDWVVDQTLALEPTWTGFVAQYTPQQPTPITLNAVTFTAISPVDAAAQTPYRQALRLARLRLWQAAHDQIAPLKASHPDSWPPLAEAQRRLMAHHAHHTRHQADAAWSTPLQQVLALLADARWEAALRQVEASPDLLPPLLHRLAGDDARFWNRVLGAKSLPQPPEATYVWGALMVKAQDGSAAVIPWLERQAASETVTQRYQTLTQGPAISVTTAMPNPPPAPPPIHPAPAAQPNAVLGIAQPQAPPTTAQWYLPYPAAAPPARPPAQWYRIPVQAAQLNQQWQEPYTPGTANPASLWEDLSKAVQPRFQLWQWPGDGDLQPLTVRGLQVHESQVTLLATGPATVMGAVAPLAFSPDALVWLDPSRGVPPQHPTLTAAVATHLLGSAAADTEAFTALLQATTVHRLDLTTDGQPEWVLTLPETTLDQLVALGADPIPQAHKTLIFDAQGTLLYSDLRQAQTLVAFTNPAAAGLVGLVVYDGAGYQVRQWSATAQGFQAQR